MPYEHIIPCYEFTGFLIMAASYFYMFTDHHVSEQKGTNPIYIPYISVTYMTFDVYQWTFG